MENPVQLQCLRCGHTFQRSYDLHRHYRRKRQCALKFSVDLMGGVQMPAGITPEMEEWFIGLWNQMELKLWTKVEGFIDKLQGQVFLRRVSRHRPPELGVSEVRHGFGEEEIDFLTKEDMEEILTSKGEFLIQILRKVYFTDKTKVNANIYCPNWRSKTLYVWEQDQKWHRVSFDDWWSSWIEQVESWVGRWYREVPFIGADDYEVITRIFEDIRATLDWEEDTEERRVESVQRKRVRRLQRSVIHEICFYRNYFMSNQDSGESSSGESFV